MSLYNALFGTESDAPRLLKLLNIDPAIIPRFRDCYWDGEHIVIHTRTGGGNREAYQEQNDELTRLPGYVRDEDSDFDSTYANFHFLPPPEALAILQHMPASASPGEKWEALFKALEKPT